MGILSAVETHSVQQNAGDPRSELAVADQARQRLAAGLRLPAGLHPVLAAAVAVQVAPPPTGSPLKRPPGWQWRWLGLRS